MRRRISSTSVAVLVLFNAAFWPGPSRLQAQASTGKIQGRVVSSGGEPISSAQVTIDGTNLGNITNDEGFYFVNEVPPGLHTVRAQSIGYRTVATGEQRVLAGQTTTLNFVLEQAAVAVEPLVVLGERNPLFPRDQVSSRAIVSGELIDELPVDNAASIILLAPGVVSTNGGLSMRGAREGEHAVYVDGVPVRELLDGATSYLALPTNALAQVDITTGATSARYGNAQSGLVNYVTRTGGAEFGGTVSVFTDDLAPRAWRTGFGRAELSAGGPAPLPHMNWFIAGTVEGSKYRAMPQGFNGLTRYVPSGVDTVIRVPVTPQTAGGRDSADVVIPDYVEWDEGPTSPSQVTDRYNLTAKLSYGIGRGSRLDLTHYRYRQQLLGRGWLTGPYNPDAWLGSTISQSTLTLGGYFLLRQTAEQALALDVKASYQRDWYQYGSVAPRYLRTHSAPRSWLNPDRMEFVMDPAEWPVTDRIIGASRSDLLTLAEKVLLPGTILAARQSIDGYADQLRLNPYALRLDFPINGPGNVFERWELENRWFATAAVDWQMSHANRFWLGGELTQGEASGRTVPLYLYQSFTPLPFLHRPVVAGLFLQDRLDLGDVVLEGGLRFDYFDPSGELPLVPSFLTQLPDSLRADRWTLSPGEGPALERLSPPTGDCGGEATAAARTNAAGTVVCKEYFLPIRSRHRLSPKLAVSFPVTATATFRFSYGHSIQPPSLVRLFAGVDYAEAGNGRDVALPATVAVEAGYRQVFGANTVIDLSVYSRTTRNALTYRPQHYQNPVTGEDVYVNVLENADVSLARGADLVLRRRLGEAFDVNVNYSFLDARGTGADPWDAFQALAGASNLAVQLGHVVEPPEVMRMLDQSRTHTLTGTMSFRTGHDFLQAQPLVHAALADFSLFATLRASSGLPYTRCENQAIGMLGPAPRATCLARAAETLNSSRTPSEKRFDLRLVRSLPVLGRTARLFADFRNPLGLTNIRQVYLETGTTVNARHRDKVIEGYLAQSSWDGDTDVDTFDIRKECEKDSPVNQYLVLQAERRFGDGDGIFTVAEQRKMIGDYYNLIYGPQTLRDADRLLRLGFEVAF